MARIPSDGPRILRGDGQRLVRDTLPLPGCVHQVNCDGVQKNLIRMGDNSGQSAAKSAVQAG
jgi:hypothetical protein